MDELNELEVPVALDELKALVWLEELEALNKLEELEELGKTDEPTCAEKAGIDCSSIMQVIFYTCKLTDISHSHSLVLAILLFKYIIQVDVGYLTLQVDCYTKWFNSLVS